MRNCGATDEQMVASLREADHTSVAGGEKNKVSDRRSWRQHFAGLASADVKRLKALT